MAQLFKTTTLIACLVFASVFVPSAHSQDLLSCGDTHNFHETARVVNFVVCGSSDPGEAARSVIFGEIFGSFSCPECLIGCWKFLVFSNFSLIGSVPLGDPFVQGGQLCQAYFGLASLDYFGGCTVCAGSH